MALTEKISSSTSECNGLNTVKNPNVTRSDMMTGVSTNSIPTPNLQQPPRTLPTPATNQTRNRAPSTNDPQMDDVMTEIHNLRTTKTDGVIQPKILQTQVPLFRGNRDKYNEFEHLLKNHLRPHMNKLTEKQKLNYFQSLLQDEAIEFWQTLKITTETTLHDGLQAFNKEYAKEDLREVSKNKFDQMRYDPTKESFADFLIKYKKLAKQAYGDKANDIAETFCLQNCQSRSKMNLPWQANTMPRSKKSRRLYNAVANMHNYFLAPQICSHLTRSTTTNRSQTTLSRPPTTTTPRRTPQEKSNEDSKDIADTATYWATSGSNAANASGTKPTE